MVDTIENRLARLARAGDRGAFRELVDLYKDRLFNLAYRMLGNRHEAEEIVQDTFLRVFSHLDSYNAEKKFSTWIYRIAHNLCIDRMRKRRKVYSLDAELPEGEGIDGYAQMPLDESSPEELLLVSETQRHVREAILELPDKYRSAVILKYLQDLSLNEIAEILDLPVTTVKTRVHRGREFLRKKLEESGTV